MQMVAGSSPAAAGSLVFVCHEGHQRLVLEPRRLGVFFFSLSHLIPPCPEPRTTDSKVGWLLFANFFVGIRSAVR